MPTEQQQVQQEDNFEQILKTFEIRFVLKA